MFTGMCGCKFMRLHGKEAEDNLGTPVPSNLYFETISFSLVQSLPHSLDHGASSRNPFTYLPVLGLQE